jgi:hypothetical protein
MPLEPARRCCTGAPRARGLAVLLLVSLLALPAAGWAASWGGIEPGVTTLEQVREGYGQPSKEALLKVDGYDTTQWVYEGPRAPTGMVRMVVDFGLLTPAGYKPQVVRTFRLEPKRMIFTRGMVVFGWGVPDGVVNRGGHDSYLYKSGLVATFEKDEGESAISLVFAPPQPDALPAGSAPPPGQRQEPASPAAPAPPRR